MKVQGRFCPRANAMVHSVSLRATQYMMEAVIFFPQAQCEQRRNKRPVAFLLHYGTMHATAATGLMATQSVGAASVLTKRNTVTRTKLKGYCFSLHADPLRPFAISGVAILFTIQPIFRK